MAHEVAQPKNYDKALPEYSPPAKLGLDAIKDFGKGTMGQTNHSVLGGGSVFSPIHSSSAQTHSLDKIVSQKPSFAGSHLESQVPNSGSSHGSVTTKAKVESKSVSHSSKSYIFHG